MTWGHTWKRRANQLLGTVRQYGQEQLAIAGETTPARDRHLAWYLALAAEGAAGIKGSEQVAWRHRLELEHDNFRAALAWSALAGTLASTDRSPGVGSIAGLRLAGALWWFWVLHGHLQEGLRWLAAALVEDAFAAAWEQGKALSLEEAIALALAQDAPGVHTP